MIEPVLYSTEISSEKRREQERRFAQEQRRADPERTVKKELKSMKFVGNYISKKTPSKVQPMQPIPSNIGTSYSDWLKSTETKRKLNRQKIFLSMVTQETESKVRSLKNQTVKKKQVEKFDI